MYDFMSIGSLIMDFEKIRFDNIYLLLKDYQL